MKMSDEELQQRGQSILDMESEASFEGFLRYCPWRWSPEQCLTHTQGGAEGQDQHLQRVHGGKRPEAS